MYVPYLLPHSYFYYLPSVGENASQVLGLKEGTRSEHPTNSENFIGEVLISRRIDEV